LPDSPDGGRLPLGGDELDVMAETLHEAISQTLATVRRHDWVGDIRKGLTTVTVKVRNPEATHIVKIQDSLGTGCRNWSIGG
jgi:hypothetical protein